MAAQLICNQWVAGSTPVTSSKKNRLDSLKSRRFFLFVTRYLTRFWAYNTLSTVWGLWPLLWVAVKVAIRFKGCIVLPYHLIAPGVIVKMFSLLLF